MVEFAKKESRRALTEKRQELEVRLARIREEEDRLKAREIVERPRKRQVRESPLENWWMQTDEPLLS